MRRFRKPALACFGCSGMIKKLLIANPTLIKRPVIETGADVHVGWTKDVQAVF